MVLVVMHSKRSKCDGDMNEMTSSKESKESFLSYIFYRAPGSICTQRKELQPPCLKRITIPSLIFFFFSSLQHFHSFAPSCAPLPPSLALLLLNSPSILPFTPLPSLPPASFTSSLS